MPVENELKKLKKGETVLLITSSSKYFKVSSEMLHYLTVKKKEMGIYISIIESYDKIVKKIPDADWSKILFLDGGKGASENSNATNRIALQGPTALTEMGLYVTKACKETGIGFIILNSISTLIQYNGDKMGLRFIQHISEKSKQFTMIGLVTADSADEEKNIMSAVKGIVDKVIKI